MEKEINHLCLLERQELYRMWGIGWGIRRIARALGRNPTTILREIERNGPSNRLERRQPWYLQAVRAQERMLARRHTKRPRLRLKSMRIRNYVSEKLVGKKIGDRLFPGWTPEQIANRLPIDLPGKSISHEAIYQWIFTEATEFICCLERLGKYRRRRKRTENLGRKVKRNEDKQHISERPAAANDRSEFGHCERDSVVSAHPGKSALHNCLERKTRHLRATKIPNLSAQSGKQAVIRLFREQPPQARRSFTNDNGPENGEAHSIQLALGSEIYWCTPHAAWERGSIERANRTLRRIFPKGTNFDLVTEADVDNAVCWYNNRPMKVLGFRTPQEAYTEEIKLLANA